MVINKENLFVSILSEIVIKLFSYRFSYHNISILFRLLLQLYVFSFRFPTPALKLTSQSNNRNKSLFDSGLDFSFILINIVF